MAYILNQDIRNSLHHHKTLCKSKEDIRRKFFMHYQSHSKQLVDALKQWGEELRFTSSCEYEDGKLDIEYSNQVEPIRIPFMGQMKKHLQKAYPQILSKCHEIEANHRQLCDTIKKIMIVQYNLSFQKIIVDKIYYSCRKLRPSRDLNLTHNNIYTQRHLFKFIFEAINDRKRSLEPLDVSRVPGSSTYQLWHEHYWILAQGDEMDMCKLKHALNELVIDNELCSMVSKYHQIHYDLTHDDQIENLKDDIQQLCDFIHGGQLLGGYPVCESCKPSSIDSIKT